MTLAEPRISKRGRKEIEKSIKEKERRKTVGILQQRVRVKGFGSENAFQEKMKSEREMKQFFLRPLKL
jgi:hypothetical protein